MQGERPCRAPTFTHTVPCGALPSPTGAPWLHHANNLHLLVNWRPPTQATIEVDRRGPVIASWCWILIVYLIFTDHDGRLLRRGLDVVTNPDEFDDCGGRSFTEVRAHLV